MKVPTLKQEDKKQTQVFDDFQGMNTKPSRTALKENEFYWLENIIPVGPGNLQVVSQASSMSSNLLYSSNTTPARVAYATQATLKTGTFDVFFFTSGAMVWYNVDTNTSGIVSAGIASPYTVSTSQYGNEYLLITDANGGYRTWDGTNLVSVGSVGAIIVTAGGSSYSDVPIVSISAPNETGGVQATATAVLTSGAVSSISIDEAGSGYTSPPTVTITGGSGSGATAVAALQTFKTGTLSATLDVGGTDYTSAPTVVLTGGDGSGAVAVAKISSGVVTEVIFTNPGTGYTTAPTISFSGGGGSGAKATAVVNTDTISAVQSFSGRVWIATGRNVYYSASGSATDFVSTSAGYLSITDQTLVGDITALLSANNFLYIFGKSCINVISDVRVNTSGVTIFTNTNVSSNIGTKWRNTITAYFRSVVFMNESGVYALVGSTASKISDGIDGVLKNIIFTDEQAYPITSAQAIIQNSLCVAFLFAYNDPSISQIRNVMAVFFEKKWFISDQKYLSNEPYFVFQGIGENGPEIHAPIYGTNTISGTQYYGHYPCILFNDGTVSTPWKVQTALWSMGYDMYVKSAMKWDVDTRTSTVSNVTLTIDTESATSDEIVSSIQRVITFQDNSGVTLTWVNDSGEVLTWVAGDTTFAAYKGVADMRGRYLGMTLTGTNYDTQIVRMAMLYEVRGDWE